MRIRYLPDMLRHMRYHNLARYGETDSYMLQIVDDHRMVFSEIAPTDEALLKGAKAVGIPIRGKHWADYMLPENALEKRMMDDVKLLSSIVAKAVTIETLEALGYTKREAKKILKDAAYVIAEDSTGDAP